MAPILTTGAGKFPAISSATFSYLAGVCTAVGGFGGGSTGAIDTTGAGLLIAVTSYYLGTGETLTDSKSNTWNALTVSTSANSKCNIYWSKPSSVGSSHTVSFTGSSIYPTVAFAAFTLGAASPFDQESQRTSTSTSALSNTITPTVDNELVIAGVTVAANGLTISAPTGGFTTIGSTTSGVGGTNMGGGAAYLIQTSAAAIGTAPAWTLSGSTEWTTKTASFKVS